MTRLLVLVLMVWSSAAQALTAYQLGQLWAWKLGRVGVGVTVGTTEVRPGLRILKDVRLTATGLATATGVVATLAEIDLSEDADGSVRVDFVGAVGAKGDPGVGPVSLGLVRDGLTLVAREVTGGVRYDFAAKAMSVEAAIARDAGFAPDVGVVVPKSTMLGAFEFTQLTGQYLDAVGESQIYSLDLGAQAASYRSTIRNPKSGQGEVSTATENGWHLHALAAWPLGMAWFATPEDFVDGLKRGLHLEFGNTDAGSTQGKTFTGDTANSAGVTAMSFAVTSGAARTRVEVDRGGFRLDYAGDGANVVLRSALIAGKEAVVGLGPMALHLAFPLLAHKAERFGFSLSLQDVAASAGLWQAVDPAGVFPRDPVNVTVDVAGKVQVDVAAMAKSGFNGPLAVPVFEALHIGQMSFAGFGTAVSAHGNFVSNAAGKVPVGSAEVTIDGADAVLDGLVKLGAITAAQAGTARTELAMGFDKVGGKTDRMMSRVEARRDGSVYVNGARFR